MNRTAERILFVAFAMLGAIVLGYILSGNAFLWLAIGAVTAVVAWLTMNATKDLKGPLWVGGAVLVVLVAAPDCQKVGSQGRGKSPATMCLSNIKQISLGLMFYANDYDGQYALADSWWTVTCPYLKAPIVLCPSDNDPGHFDYAFNKTLSGKVAANVPNPAETILSFECESTTPNPNGGKELFYPRHEERGSVAYSDGHVKSLTRSMALPTLWNPDPPIPDVFPTKQKNP